MPIQVSLEALKSFNTLLESISKLQAKDLIRRDDLGVDLNFASAENDFETTINLFKGLEDIDITRVPESQLKRITEAMNQFIGLINQIKSFSAVQGPQTRQSLIDNIINNYPNWFSIISPVVAYCVKSGTDYDALQRKAREALDEFYNLQKQAEVDRDNAQKTIEETLNAVKKAAAEVGVTQHTTNFKEAADDFAIQKTYWMKAIGWTLAGIIIYSFTAFWFCPIELKEPYLYVFLQSALL